MPEVHLRKVSQENYREVLNLTLHDAQAAFVASNAKSFAEAYVNPALVPLAIYDAAARGWELPSLPVVGFTVYELAVGVGFILRLRVDQKYQRRGIGREAMQEVIRRLKLRPGVEMIATSHRRENEAAARLYQSLGFVECAVPWPDPDPQEIYLRLPDRTADRHF